MRLQPDPMLTIRPPPVSFMKRPAYCVHRKHPFRFVSITRSHSCSSRSSSGFHTWHPALFTSRSSRGKRSRTLANIRRTASAFPTSASIDKAERPSASIWATVSAAPAGSPKSFTATSQPERANSTAIPRPIPLAAPVTSAVFDWSGRFTFVAYIVLQQMRTARWLRANIEFVRFTADPTDAGKRLDLAVHVRMPAYSRSRIQDWIKSGRVLVNGSPGRASQSLRPSDTIDVEPADPPPLHASPEDIPLTILYEDDDIIAIDKPAGMVVHAGAGVHSGTVVNALLHRFRSLSGVGGAMRPGIVHRLDRYTSGVLLVARNDTAHQRLAAQFSGRQIEKVYLALVHGDVQRETARLQRPIARAPRRRTRMRARLQQ